MAQIEYVKLLKKLKNKNDYNLIVDIQGDEPLVSPIHIDKVIEFHLKNLMQI